MLKRVEINNFALIETAIFEPGKHLTVISGETGAGKSLLIDALGSLTGKRSNREVVRTGSDFARVEAVFEISPQLMELELFHEITEDNLLFLSREIFADGGSQARINGRLANISMLKEVSEYLIGLHAQHEQQAIFDVNEQRALLDRYIGKEMSDLLKQWQSLLQNRKRLVQQLREYGLNPAERSRQLDLIKYQIEEIKEADLKIGEDEQLLKRNRALATLTRMKQDLTKSRETLSADTAHGAASLLAQAAGDLEYSSRYSEKIKQYQADLKQMAGEISELAINLSDVYNELKAEPNEVELINQRLDLIDKLKIKYGDSIEQILDYLNHAELRLNKLLEGEELFATYREELLANEEKISKTGNLIHDLRIKSGKILSKEICEALKKLAMPNLKFMVEVKKLEKGEKGYYSKYGSDQVQFFIQPNPGEPLMPLDRIASGGEVSRILLAIKSILGRNEQLTVLIFDEIDSGVSGVTAISVAEMLRDLATDKQVLCVSHMAQVAAAADSHFLIEKNVIQDRTHTDLVELKPKNSLQEIARLLSGNPEDQSSLALASEMYNLYQHR